MTVAVFHLRRFLKTTMKRLDLACSNYVRCKLDFRNKREVFVGAILRGYQSTKRLAEDAFGELDGVDEVSNC